jgi:predicted RNA-binding Zn-ribbon protein involved in translation (DUF1610 family)
MQQHCGYHEAVQDQITLYHDKTAFWLDKEWKTPREKMLEKKFEEISLRVATLEKRVNDASCVVRTILGFNDLQFHCPHCNKKDYVKYRKELKRYACQNCGAAVF